MKAGRIWRWVRLRTMKKGVRTITATTLVRKRTLPYTIESTISNLPKLRVLA